MLNLAAAELRMLWRNRLVATCALLVPIGIGVLLIVTRERFAEPALPAALCAVVMEGMGVYVTATTALAGRRQSLYLKRLRTTRLSAANILGGVLTPIAAVSVIQVAVILVVLAVISVSPSSLLLVTLGVLLGAALFLPLAVATAGRTSSPEQAQITTLPVFLAASGAAAWIAVTGMTDYEWLKLLVPGGAVFELIATGWSAYGPTPARALVLVAINLAWILAGAALARVTFTWEPRT